MIKVAVVGYGVIGQRLADGVALQEDMELVGIADVAPTISLRALKARGMPYDLYCAVPGMEQGLEDAGIPVKGNIDDLLSQVDVALDATGPGIGAKNKELYVKHGVKGLSLIHIFFCGEAVKEGYPRIGFGEVRGRILEPLFEYEAD